MTMDERLIEKTISFITELFRDNAGGHDAAHTLRVYQMALRIAKTEPSCDMQAVALAALLHDADDDKLFSTENNANARAFLQEQKLSEEEIERICGMINAVSFSKNRDKIPETIEAMIVQDADRLDAMGAVGIARTFAYGGEHGRPMQESLQHFQDKLLLLRKRMNTEAGKKLAEERHAFLEEFLRRFIEETTTV